MYIREKKGGKEKRFYLGIYRICINIFIAHVFEHALGPIPSSLDISGKINIDKTFVKALNF